MQTPEEILAGLEARIDALRLNQKPENLYEPINYTMAKGGKRIRPLLALLSAQLNHLEIGAYFDAALSVEYFHNFTLIHDDIMDKAPLRRGRSTVWNKWNPNIAILSGDALFIKSLQLASNLSPDVYQAFTKRFLEVGLWVCDGQQLDMDFESAQSVTVDDYIEMIKLKTAVLLGFSLEAGAIWAKASDDIKNRLFNIGVNFGIGFQLLDDWLDTYGQSAAVGKQIGGDILSNKKTFLYLYALANAHPTDQKSLIELYSDNLVIDGQAKINAVKHIFDKSGAANATFDKADSYFNQAFWGLKYFPTSNKDALSVIVNIFDSLKRREN